MQFTSPRIMSSCVLPLDSEESIPSNTVYPWMAVLIAQPRKNGSIVAICGGSLVSDRFILTAAHCFNILPDHNMFKVRLGGWNITTDRSCDDRICSGRIVDYAIERVFVHQDFNSSNIHYDIALIKLAKSVAFTDFVSPICIAESISCKIPQDAEKIFRAVGWNIVEVEYVANLTDFIGDRHQFSIEMYSVYRNSCDYVFWPTLEICTKRVNKTNDQFVDFGRSLISKENDGYWFLYGYGVWEFGNPDAMPYESDIFTRIACYRDWIKSILKNSTTCS